ncbi:MAG TPA: hypothetical protein VFL73_02460 [Solirubrobacteraceae bacterium]|nr:hypothetical protein [Solirubrobacteraceae bacterium]
MSAKAITDELVQQVADDLEFAKRFTNEHRETFERLAEQARLWRRAGSPRSRTTSTSRRTCPALIESSIVAASSVLRRARRVLTPRGSPAWSARADRRRTGPTPTPVQTPGIPGSL